MKQLNNHTVTRPTRPITILQFGSGNFLRGFADWMVGQANAAGLTDHGIAIAYATHRPEPRRDPLVDQDGKELIAADKAADDAFLKGVNFYIKGVEGKVPGK